MTWDGVIGPFHSPRFHRTPFFFFFFFIPLFDTFWGWPFMILFIDWTRAFFFSGLFFPAAPPEQCFRGGSFIRPPPCSSPLLLLPLPRPSLLLLPSSIFLLRLSSIALVQLVLPRFNLLSVNLANPQRPCLIPKLSLTSNTLPWDLVLVSPFLFLLACLFKKLIKLDQTLTHTHTYAHTLVRVNCQWVKCICDTLF